MWRNLARRTTVGGNDKYVRIPATVKSVACTIGDKGDRFAVRRPGRFVVIEIAVRKLACGSGRNVDDKDVRKLIAQQASPVLSIMKVPDDSDAGQWIVAIFPLADTRDDGKPPAVVRPDKVGDTVLEITDARNFAAGNTSGVDLRALVFAFAGNESDVTAVR